MGTISTVAQVLFGAILILSVPSHAWANTIVSVASPAGKCCANLGGVSQQILAIGWDQSVAEPRVSISVTVGKTGANPNITAYLMSRIGPGTTAAANQIASVTLTPVSAMEIDVLFPALFLPAGSYYLVLSGTGQDSQGWAYDNTGSSLVEGSMTEGVYAGVVNVTAGDPDDYAPASTFSDISSQMALFGLSIDVSNAPGGQSAPIATPEPSSALLICAGGTMLGSRFLGHSGRR